MRVKRSQLSNANQQGYTLVELILVLSILALLASIAIGEFYYRRKSAFDMQAIAVAKNLLTLAATSFANDEIPAQMGLSKGTSPEGYPELETNVGIHTYIWKDYDEVDAEAETWSFYVASEGGSTAYFFWLPGDNCTLTAVKGYPSDIIIDNEHYNEEQDPDEDWRANPDLDL